MCMPFEMESAEEREGVACIFALPASTPTFNLLLTKTFVLHVMINAVKLGKLQYSLTIN